MSKICMNCGNECADQANFCTGCGSNQLREHDVNATTVIGTEQPYNGAPENTAQYATPQPTYQPAPQPTYQPAPQPTYQPAPQPTYQPAPQPTYQPAPQPTYQPASQPTYQPAPQPTYQPASQPTYQSAPQPTYQAAPQPTYQQTPQPMQPAPLSMSWYKFLINFALFASAVLNFVIGILQMTGGIYESQTDYMVTSEMVYAFFGNGLKALDMIYGFLLIAAAGFAIFTRFQLSGYRKNGPLFLMILYGANVALSVIYLVAVSIIVESGDLISSSSVASIGISIAMTIANYFYFKKRKHLFVN